MLAILSKVVPEWELPDRGPGHKILYRDGEVLCGVEELVIRRWCAREEGWKGLHCEGGLFGALFTLLLWDVIYGCVVPDVFITPYQVSDVVVTFVESNTRWRFCSCGCNMMVPL